MAGFVKLRSEPSRGLVGRDMRATMLALFFCGTTMLAHQPSIMYYGIFAQVF